MKKILRKASNVHILSASLFIAAFLIVGAVFFPGVQTKPLAIQTVHASGICPAGQHEDNSGPWGPCPNSENPDPEMGCAHFVCDYLDGTDPENPGSGSFGTCTTCAADTGSCPELTKELGCPAGWTGHNSVTGKQDYPYCGDAYGFSSIVSTDPACVPPTIHECRDGLPAPDNDSSKCPEFSCPVVIQHQSCAPSTFTGDESLTPWSYGYTNYYNHVIFGGDACVFDHADPSIGDAHTSACANHSDPDTTSGPNAYDPSCCPVEDGSPAEDCTVPVTNVTNVGCQMGQVGTHTQSITYTGPSCTPGTPVDVVNTCVTAPSGPAACYSDDPPCNDSAITILSFDSSGNYFMPPGLPTAYYSITPADSNGGTLGGNYYQPSDGGTAYTISVLPASGYTATVKHTSGLGLVVGNMLTLQPGGDLGLFEIFWTPATTAAINVTPNVGSATWAINPGGLPGTGATGVTVMPGSGGQLYTITPGNVPGYAFPPTITNTKAGGSSMFVLPGETDGFSLLYSSGGGAFTYSLSVPDTLVISKGATPQLGQRVITKTLTSGTGGPVTLSVSGLPAGATLTGISNQGCSPTPIGVASCPSTVSISVDPSTAQGRYPITITGSPGSVGVTFNLLVANSAAMLVSCVPEPSPAQIGQPVTWTATVTSGGGTAPFTYAWAGNDIPTPGPTTSSFTITYTSAGPKSAVATVTDAGGAIASCTTISGAPAARVLVQVNPIYIEQ